MFIWQNESVNETKHTKKEEENAKEFKEKRKQNK
jgi:hypothetical protein